MQELTRRERVYNAMHFKPVDKVALRYYYSSVGYYEHGDKLNDLFATLPGDFGPFVRRSVQGPDPTDFDAQGNYHAFSTDPWGVTWEYRIYGVSGLPCKRPVNSPEDAETYQTPPHLLCEGPEFEELARQIRERKEQDYPGIVQYTCFLYERLISLYGDENVLCDIAMNEVGINKLADSIAEYNEAAIKRAVKAGADHITILDDYGSERNVIMGPDTWRRFIKPRLKRIFQSAVDANVDIHFHSCGQIYDILPDLKDVGVTSIWPQIPVFNMVDLAKRCREIGLAVEVHTDRGNTMTYGTPDQVRELVKREFDTFKMMDGGAWMYVEVDNAFPFANIEAQIETLAQFR